MSLTVLSVAYPLAPVGPDSTGGSEQVLTAIDQALARSAHRSIVIACEGSKVAGTLVAVPRETAPYDNACRARSHARHADAISAVLARENVDLVHLHGIDFHAYLPPPGVPVLATLHLPADWYPPEALRPSRPETWLHCVSRSAHEKCPTSPNLLDPIENGVPTDDLSARSFARRGFALFLGRICPEKGVHLAIDAAKHADVPLLIAGEVYPYESHVAYFEDEVLPRLDARMRYIGPVGFRAKRRLLSSARCLLIPSLAEETSSLVAREAPACGTPVVAFRLGALAETVENDETGFLVDDVEEMAAAISRSGDIDPEACRAVARRRFSVQAMTDRYLALYDAIAAGRMSGAA